MATVVTWSRDRALTLALLAMFLLLLLAGQLVTGLYEYHATHEAHGLAPVGMTALVP
jgi:hypothetical protein